MIRRTFLCLSEAMAACMVDPVAIPSSTRITVFSVTSTRGRPLRYACSRRESSACSRCWTAVTASVPIPRAVMRALLRNWIPPEAIAPMASSSCPGTPSFLTRRTSSGMFSARATSKPTGTPPRGSASTMASGEPPCCRRRSASCRPASLRSWNRMIMAALLFRRGPYAVPLETMPGPDG